MKWFWQSKTTGELPDIKYDFRFQVCYRLARGTDRCTGVIALTITAKSEKDARDKLNKFVRTRSRIEIKSMEINVDK